MSNRDRERDVAAGSGSGYDGSWDYSAGDNRPVEDDHFTGVASRFADTANEGDEPPVKTSVAYWIWMICLIELPVIGVVVFYWKKSRLLGRGLSKELYYALLSWAWVTTGCWILNCVIIAFKVLTGVSSFLGVVSEVLTHWG